MNFELMSQSFHSNGVLGVDTCIRKPIVATCSFDRSVRLWNYVEKSVELAKYFPEEAYRYVWRPIYISIGKIHGIHASQSTKNIWRWSCDVEF